MIAKEYQRQKPSPQIRHRLRAVGQVSPRHTAANDFITREGIPWKTASPPRRYGVSYRHTALVLARQSQPQDQLRTRDAHVAGVRSNDDDYAAIFRLRPWKKKLKKKKKRLRFPQSDYNSSPNRPIDTIVTVGKIDICTQENPEKSVSSKGADSKLWATISLETDNFLSIHFHYSTWNIIHF